jgi:hypothetical protein
MGRRHSPVVTHHPSFYTESVPLATSQPTIHPHLRVNRTIFSTCTVPAPSVRVHHLPSQEGVRRVSSNAAGSRTWLGSSESMAATPSDPYHLITGGTFPSELYWSNPSAAPPWGVRALKFKKNESGKEVLALTQVSASVVSYTVPHLLN